MRISWTIFLVNFVSESNLIFFSSVMPVNAAFQKNFLSSFCCLVVAQCCCLLPWATQKGNDATYSYILLQQASTMSSNIRIEKTCEVCGNKYIAKRTVTRSCFLNFARLLYKRTKRYEKKKQSFKRRLQ
jgi:hypothetical protein